jgi:hypothetical protein
LANFNVPDIAITNDNSTYVYCRETVS